jgi:hypothetical protein
MIHRRCARHLVSSNQVESRIVGKVVQEFVTECMAST